MTTLKIVTGSEGVQYYTDSSDGKSPIVTIAPYREHTVELPSGGQLIAVEATAEDLENNDLADEADPEDLEDIYDEDEDLLPDED